jgi:hypothetical protein
MTAAAATITGRRYPLAAALVLVAAIALQRFALPFGEGGIALALPVAWLVAGALALGGRLDVWRVALFGLLAAAAAVSAAINLDAVSPDSFALLLATYAPFLVAVPVAEGEWRRALGVFQALAALCAGLGLIQFAAQFAFDAPWLFTFKGVLPEAILQDGYNTIVPLSYGAPVFKSNGGILLEPSIFSQILALALLIEILAFGRAWRLALFAAALPVAYSGTGLLLLAVFLGPILIRRRAHGIAAGLALGAFVIVVLGDVWHADALFRRLGEWQSTQTSGFARFLSAFWLLGDHVADDPVALLFGRGPGSIAPAMAAAPYAAHDPTWGKALFEYGIVGTAALAAFIGVCLFRGTPSRGLSAVLLFGYLFFGGMLLDSRYAAVLLALAVWPRIERPGGDRAEERSRNGHALWAS